MTTQLLQNRASGHLFSQGSGDMRGQRRPRRPMEQHHSVLIEEVIATLSPKSGDSVLDATGGAGGHSEALLNAAQTELIVLDADPNAVERVRTRLERFGSRARVIEGNFRDTAALLPKHGITTISKALFDLGWNRTQLVSGRGFSFSRSEPLNMSYSPQPASGFTAAEILNSWTQQAIADVLYGYAQERYARRIAKNIVETRTSHPLQTTEDLISILEKSVPAAYRHGRVHFATKTFQALRVAVNDELKNLDHGIRGAWKLLTKGGRLAVISFHSTEDRAVKRLFQEFLKHEEGILVNKKPITASAEEITEHPSSRSAKLRVIEKTK